MKRKSQVGEQYTSKVAKNNNSFFHSPSALQIETETLEVLKTIAAQLTEYNQHIKAQTQQQEEEKLAEQKFNEMSLEKHQSMYS